MSSDSEQKQNTHKLIKKASDGDESAFGQVYDVYFERIYKFVHYRTSHKQTAEDLTAEIFIKAWDNISGIDKPKAFEGWLFQIARNRVIDHYRTRKSTADIDKLENVLEYEDNILDKVNLDFQQKIALEKMDKLSDDQQLVLKLKFFDDLENSEISKILDKPEGTVRVIQHRAIKELTKLINEHKENG